MREMHYRVIQVDMNLLDECMGVWYPKKAIDKHSVIVKCTPLAKKIIKSQKYLYDHLEHNT